MILPCTNRPSSRTDIALFTGLTMSVVWSAAHINDTPCIDVTTIGCNYPWPLPISIDG